MKSYKHDLYLIEPTKLLEGILCQSLSFTNTLGTAYLESPVYASVNGYTNTTPVGYFPAITQDNSARTFLGTLYSTPVDASTPLKVYTPYELALYICTQYDSLLTASNISVAKVTLKGTEESAITYVKGLGGNTDEYIETAITGTNVTMSYELTIEAGLGTYEQKKSVISFKYYLGVATNRYPTKPWTITDCINRCLELAEPLYKGQNPRYKLQGVTYENGEIKPYDNDHKYEPGSLAEKYDKIMAPEFTMTSCTLREQLKIIGGKIHAEPRLGYKRRENDAILYDEDVIIFEPYALGNQAQIASLPYVSRGTEQSLNEYSSEVVSNVQNIVNSISYAKGVTIQPNVNNLNTIRTDNVNVKVGDIASSIAKTNRPIYKPVKVMCGIYNANDTNNPWLISPVDITAYIFEEYEYNNLSSYEGNYPNVKSYALCYKQGSHDITGMFYKPPTNSFGIVYFDNYAIVNILQACSGLQLQEVKDAITDNAAKLAFQVSYIPIYNSKFSHGKQYVIDNPAHPFVTTYNQSENLIENSAYGEHIKGVAQRLGNVEETRTYKVGKKSMIPKVGEKIGDYFISAVTYDFTHYWYKVTVALTKDFNRISQYVGVNSTKRISEVSEKEAYSRDVLIKEKICIGNNDNVPLAPAKLLRTLTPVTKAFGADVPSYNVPITACVAQGSSKDGQNQYNRVVLPVIASAFGNSMVFGWSYKDNYSAGEKVELIDQAYWQGDLPYSDYYGRIWWYDFQLRYNYADGGFNQALTCLETAEGSFNTAYNDIGTVGYNNGAYTKDSYRLRKDSRETPDFNYEIEFVTDREDINIGSALASCNPLVTEYGTTPKDVAVYFLGSKISKFESNIVNLDVLSRTVSLDGNKLQANKIEFELPQDLEFEGWVVCYPLTVLPGKTYTDENGNDVVISNEYAGGEILLSCNKSSADYRAEEKTKESLSIQAYSNY